MDETRIQEFWNSHPCGDQLVGGLEDTHRGDYEEFFTEYDRFRYTLEDHIPACLDAMHVDGKRVLEIGLGQGAESEQLIRRGAIWSGIDLTQESVDRVATRLALHDLPHEDLRRASVTEIPFGDAHFDLVFSHGVLHHVPDIGAAQREIHRVLRPDGELVVMVYARWSLNYLVAIGVVRRAGLLATYPLARGGLLRPKAMLDAHVRNAAAVGLTRYLRMDEFVHHNTDGPDNPFSRVYDVPGLRRDFPDFEITRVEKHFMHAPSPPRAPLPRRGRGRLAPLGPHAARVTLRRSPAGRSCTRRSTGAARRSRPGRSVVRTCDGPRTRAA